MTRPSTDKLARDVLAALVRHDLLVPGMVVIDGHDDRWTRLVGDGWVNPDGEAAYSHFVDDPTLEPSLILALHAGYGRLDLDGPSAWLLAEVLRSPDVGVDFVITACGDGFGARERSPLGCASWATTIGHALAALLLEVLSQRGMWGDR